MTSYSKILAIETATRHQALALLDGPSLLGECVQRVRYNHGSSLLENIDALLTAARHTPADIDLFCVGLGPGSFTGLRVGLATFKALARSADKPIVGFSSLAANAYCFARTNPDAFIAPSFDARRHEVYAGLYQWDRNSQTLRTILPDDALSPEAWALKLSKLSAANHIIQVGEGPDAYPFLHEASTVLPAALTPPSALAIALLGREKALRDGPDNLITLEPNYIRNSDAKLPPTPLVEPPELKRLQASPTIKSPS